LSIEGGAVFIPLARPIRRIVSSLLAVALLAMAGGAMAADTYDIDTILPLTGPNSFVGNEEREAFGVLEAAANRGGGIRGRSIHFAILDSQSSPQLAVQLTSQLLASHPAVLIGDSGNSTCTAMAPILAGGPVHFCLSNGFRPVQGGNSYVIGASPAQQAAAFLRYARGRGWHRIAMINGNDATGDSAESAMRGELAKPENHDMTAVDAERFNANDISIGAQLAKIRAARAQVLSTYSAGAAFGIVLHGLHDAGLELPVFASQGNLSYVEMKQYAENLPRTLYFVSGPLPAEGQPVENGPLRATDLAYLDAFRRAGIKPDWGHAVAWDTGSVVIAALRARGLDAAPSELRAYIDKLHDLPAIQGELDFRTGTRRGVADLRVLAWDDARATWSIASQNGGTPKTR
jgi:branched-chain amino acid transport system substrate-binding protein